VACKDSHGFVGLCGTNPTAAARRLDWLLSAWAGRVHNVWALMWQKTRSRQMMHRIMLPCTEKERLWAMYVACHCAVGMEKGWFPPAPLGHPFCRPMQCPWHYLCRGKHLDTRYPPEVRFAR
jgi:hypothetical protein